MSRQNDYSFAAAPKVVKPKKKYKEPVEEQQEEQIKLTYNNLMWDKRIVRGNTYAAIVTSKNVEIPHKNTYKQKATFFKPDDSAADFGATAAGQRRANIQIFTDEFVETLTDKPPRYEKDCQTEFVIEKPVVRLYMHQKTGSDVETQIWDNELFDFDYEVQPLLRVLCGKTLEISRAEVLQEEELRVMKERQKYLKDMENQESDKIKAMEQREVRLKEENDKKITLLKQKKESQRNCHRRLVSRVMAKQFLKYLKPNTLDLLEEGGLFRSQVDHKLTEFLCPYLYVQTEKELNDENSLQNGVWKILKEVENDVKKQHRLAMEAQKTRKANILKARKEREQEKVERKLMRAEEQHMKKYLVQLKALEEKLEEQKRLAEEKEAQAQEQA